MGGRDGASSVSECGCDSVSSGSGSASDSTHSGSGSDIITNNVSVGGSDSSSK